MVSACTSRSIRNHSKNLHCPLALPPDFPITNGYGERWNTFAADGGTDIHATLSLSGEAPVPQLSASFGEVAGTLPVPTINDIWALQRRKYEYQTRYLAYWNSTATLTKSGRPVDALIAPAAPTASFLPGNGLYFGYTGVFNVLDSSVVVVPITKVDKTRDPKVEGYVPAGDLDTLVWQQCMYFPNQTEDGTSLLI
jgi:amidase